LGRYADGEVLAVVEPVPDEAGTDAGGVLAEAGVDVMAVGDVVGVEVGEVVGEVDVVGVGVVDLVGVGVGVTLAGGGVYAGALDEALGEADGVVLVGALDEGAGAVDVTAAGCSLSRGGVCLVAAVTTKTAAPTAPSITPMISASMSGRIRRRRGRFPLPGGPYMPPGGVGGVFPSGDVDEPYPSGGVVGPYPGGGGGEGYP
jgi:hypothetical protein